MVGARTSCIACIYCQTFYFFFFFIVTCIHFLYFSLYYAYLQLPFGSHSPDEPVTIRSTSRADAPFVLWLHGMSDRESYAHPLGYHIESPEVQGLSYFMNVVFEAVNTNFFPVFYCPEVRGLSYSMNVALQMTWVVFVPN